jgi:phytoene/squalene synthetase
MTAAKNQLDATYRARALPLGSARYFSHLFAAESRKAALLGLFALCAEWQALAEPGTERAVSDLKLGWWGEEVERLTMGTAVHPISRYLAALPGSTPAALQPLQATLRATILEAGGVPLERRSELEAHAHALHGIPLEIVAALAGAEAPHEAVRSLACAEYLFRSLQDYRRAARQGKMVFAVEELLAAGIENTALTADTAPPALANYLAGLREQALTRFAAAADELPPRACAAERHVLILAALGRAQLLRVEGGSPKHALLRDMLSAWRTARRAARSIGD